MIMRKHYAKDCCNAQEMREFIGRQQQAEGATCQLSGKVQTYQTGGIGLSYWFCQTAGAGNEGWQAQL